MNNEKRDIFYKKNELIINILNFCRSNYCRNSDRGIEKLLSMIVKEYKSIDDFLKEFINPFERSVFRDSYGKPIFIDYLIFEEVYKQFVKREINEKNKKLDDKEKFRILINRTKEFLQNLPRDIANKEGFSLYSALKDSFKNYPDILETIKIAEEKEIQRLEKISPEKKVALEKTINYMESKLKNG
ncbi:MAG: hypothetical protein QXU20_00125 [Candidatus Woesearchaeota archaeon]